MGLYRDDSGLVVQVDDAFASARGFTPVDPVEEQQIYSERGLEDRANERGALGAVTAGATKFLSGATLGMSDVLLGQGLSEGERAALQAEIEANPTAAMIGEGVGMIGPALATPGSALASTPTGYLSRVAGREVEQGFARGGFRGTAQALNAMGLEGGLQSVGSYIGSQALADKAVTAEGLAGALGTGYTFTVGFGGAALGVAKGSIAARRLFSRVMDGPMAAKDAESAWSIASQEAFDAERATTDRLRSRLEDIQTAKREAAKERASRKAAVQEERIRASQYTPREAYEGTPPAEAAPPAPEDVGPLPLDEGIAPPRGGEQTRIYQRPAPEAAPEPITFSPEDASAFDTSLPSALEGGGNASAALMRDIPGEATAIKKVAPRTEGGTVITRPQMEGPPEPAALEPSFATERARRFGEKAPTPAPETPLEAQLQGTKAKLDEGKALKDIKGEKAPAKARQPRQENPQIREWLDEKAAYDAVAERTGIHNMGPRAPEQLGPTSRAPFSNLRAALSNKLLPEIREATTAELLSPALAKEETRLADALEKLDSAREALQSKTLTPEQLNLLRADNKTYGGKPAHARTREVLDAAHEDALMNATEAIDPEETGRWLQRADDVERLMADLPDETDIYWNLKDDVEVIQNYEKALADVVEIAGPEAHPSAQRIADELSQATADSERKMFDRTARAVDDSEQFGPWEHNGPVEKTPAERIAYARERHLDAQRNLDAIIAQEADAKVSYKSAKDKLAETDRARKAALKLDKQNATATGKMGSAAAGLGALEILDLPGMPKASDLPVVGPLLGAYLKFKTLKAALGRKLGTVPATMDAKAAAAAARTRDRIARAVDRSLGLVEKGSRTVGRQAPKLGAILTTRIYDDGDKDAPKGAPVTAQAATRIRELAAYVSTPNAIELDVRRTLRGVTDPDVIAAAEQHRRAAMEYLLKTAPKAPEQGMMRTINWAPSPAESLAFARRLEAVNDPAGAWERFEAQSALVSLETAETLRTVYPQMFQQAQQRVLERIADAKAQVPYRTRVQMSLLYQLPLDSALEPGNLKITQSVYERKVPIPAPGSPQPPTPAVAGDTNLNQMFQTAADRSALRR